MNKNYYGKLLSSPLQNFKAKKNLDLLVHTYFLSLAHSDTSGYNVCPLANRVTREEKHPEKSNCSAVCVAENGKGKFPNVKKARIRKTKMFFENKKLLKYKTIWYAGKMSEEELEEHGWEQFKIKLIKGYEPKIETYLQGDDDLIEANQKLEYQKIKVEFLESIIKSLNTRGYNIKSAIDFLRFTMGQ